MEINLWLLRHYVDYVAAGWFGFHDLPPERVEEYAPYVEELLKAATLQHEVAPLRIGLEYVLENPESDISELGRTRYPYDDDEVRQIIRFILSFLESRLGRSEAIPSEIKLTRTSLDEWKATRKSRKGNASVSS